ncbi:MAG TPA: MBOAT family O-acyltransferase, partial [Tenuifilaceae bacterium]|nr:MBOAT family O-acyltransferase [Tenuifilaceae bacterium]
FFAFVSFFPQLVAGPIERAKHLLPQFFQKKEFNYTMASEGFRYMLWGFFAKIAVADSVAPIVDRIFANYETFNAGTLALGAILFSFQIYGDFAGYSNIAIGTAKIFGFDLMQNFNNPYFSSNIREFWSRWHISLSTWFRDYVYIPLGGSKCSKLRNGLNAMATFIISGLWHGANWTFVVWGAIHGFVYILSKPFTLKHTEVNSKVSKLVSIVLTFMVVCFAFIFFRASSINQAFQFIARIVTLSGGETRISAMGILSIAIALLFTVTLFSLEWFQRNRTHPLAIAHIKPIYRYAIYYSLIFAILYAFQTDRIFIYFQF